MSLQKNYRLPIAMMFALFFMIAFVTGLQNPMAVTAGIGEALITTVFGLSIAILGMCIHAYLSSKVKTASFNLYEVAEALVNTMENN